MDTAVLFLIFNRPELTSKVFRQIKLAKPTRLYIACDGSRPDHKTDTSLIAKTREVVTQINWPCDVKYLYRDNNLGCKEAVSSAINWFFDFEEQGIILEDDCLPSLEFFKFCHEMLTKYVNSDKVMMISGTNYLTQTLYTTKSYFFSEYYAIWGWATWKRAWQRYEPDMSSWPKLRQSNLIDQHYKETYAQKYFTHLFNQAYLGKVNTWDIQWFYTCLKHSGLTIVPSVNLISNIGLTGTHTGSDDQNYNLPVAPLGKLRHPDKIILNPNYDLDLYRTQFRSSIWESTLLQNSYLIKTISVGFTLFHLLRMKLNHQLLRNVCHTKYPKRALIVYLTLPFTNPIASIGNSHQNYYQVVELARILGEFGYNVDCIDYNSTDVRFSIKYDLIIDLHPSDTPIYESYLHKNAKRIAYLTGSNPTISNSAEIARLDQVYRKKRIKLLPRRQVHTISSRIQAYDAVFLMGNLYTFSTFSHEFKMPKTFYIPNTYQKLGYSLTSKSPKNFLFLGGVGQVHKGLDLVLEAFSQCPSAKLFVCSPFENESDFEKAYFKELHQTTNIIPVGKVDISSSAFKDIIDRCGYVILPSCSEANAGSVITCMGAGLIPLITKECGIDSSFKIDLKQVTIPHLIETIQTASAVSDATFRRQSAAVYAETRLNHSQICYTTQVRSALKSIL